MHAVQTLALLVLMASPLGVSAVANQDSFAANPIRKVVTMLQSMQKKVEEEAEKEEELYDKFMCYCKTSGGDLSKSIADNDAKIPQVEADIKEAEAKKAQLEEDLKQHQADRAAAKEAIAEATSLREKEAAAFASESGEYKGDIAAITKAVAALEAGMAGGFLQTGTAQVLRKLVSTTQSLMDDDREVLTAFLDGQQESDYTPVSGQVTGILKEMKDEMSKSLAEVTATEDAAIQSYEALMTAKKKEIELATAAIEEKTQRSGELAVSIVTMKNDLDDAGKALLEDKEFLANLDKMCETKKKEWDEIKKTRAEELVALADTIKILNDDDALELFKKTLPSASAALVQVATSSVRARTHALNMLRRAKSISNMHPERLDFIMLALKGKKIGFEKVIKMIDDMIATLKQEQLDDDHKKEYCSKQLDESDDKKKALERSVSDLGTAIEDAKSGIDTLTSEIEGLEKSIKELDKTVASATEQRKAEHEEYMDSMSENSAAKEILGFAKNRLNKFYNPRLYKAPPKKVLSEEDEIYTSFGGSASFAQISLHTNKEVANKVATVTAPPPPPESFNAYSKKSEETTGVIAMMNLLIKDLDKEMTEAETEEKNAQEDYEQMMSDSAEERASSSKSLTEKKAAKADMEGDLQAYTDEEASTEKELSATIKYIESLHNDCDWLLKFFDMRAEARSSEIDALGRAKAVLNGADFSLMQKTTRNFLERK